MVKVAIVVLADTESHGDLGRVANALELAKELKQAGDSVELIFDGAGTKWVPGLADPSHKAHPLFKEVREKVRGACAFCAGAFGATAGVKAADTKLLGEFEGHPSLRRLLVDGYQIVTF
ncbi:MAG: DsrE family protein [Myxococcales bacterium]|nr:DsrE family protein [Myxococcales bacterium]